MPVWLERRFGSDYRGLLRFNYPAMGPSATLPGAQKFPLCATVLLMALAWISCSSGSLAVDPRPQTVDPRPNIVFVMADDLGYNDVGYHGSVIKTPNIDRLAGEGVKLENYYVQQICSPSRSQFMSGRYQIHTGLQHGVITPTKPSGLPLTNPTIAEVLQQAGYFTNMVGKWHLGFFRSEYLPTSRGFDSFYGFYVGEEDYYTHERSGFLDLRNNLTPDFSQGGVYATHLFTQKATEVINDHDPSKGPLFLFLSHPAPHTPLQVPDRYEKMYTRMKDSNRQTFAGMVTCMDEGIGTVEHALKDKGLWNNTVFIFSTDNGGRINGASSNYPLRGGKGSLFEGGVRGVAFVTSPLLTNTGVVSEGFMHISDWFPTFVHLASTFDQTPLDGFDQWDMISKGTPSPRTELLHNIDILRKPVGDPLYENEKWFDTRIQAAIRQGDYKLITGDAGRHRYWSTRRNGNYEDPEEDTDGANKNVWLFNIAKDPEERKDLSLSNPRKVKQLLKRLKYYLSTSVEPWDPQSDSNAIPDRRGDNVWGPWQGLEEANFTVHFDLNP